jgi:hypothetical protein
MSAPARSTASFTSSLPLLLERRELDAGRLWRSHPPNIRHPKKQALLEIAVGAERAPEGALVVSRWAPGDVTGSTRVGPAQQTSSLEGPYRYPQSEPGLDAWHVNFADPELFAFYGGPAFAQDEIQVAEHPLLACVREMLIAQRHEASQLRALTREGESPTPMLFHDVPRWSTIDTTGPGTGIYGRRLHQASLEDVSAAARRLDDAPTSKLVAMSAPQGAGSYTPEQICDVLVTATTGFAAARAESRPSARVRVHTGHWGTGAFGGNRVLMAACQILAARIAGIDELVYYSLDAGGLRAFAEGRAIADAVEQGRTIDEVVNLLDSHDFVWGRSDGH